MKVSKSGFMWVAFLANAVGIVIYIAIGVWIKAPRPEGYELNGIDEIYLWFTRMLPVLAIATVADAIWLIKLLKSSERRGQLRVWLAVGLLWAATMVYDGLAVKIAMVGVSIITGAARK